MPGSRIVASAPSRIDLAGGTLDIWPLSVIVPGAVTVNLAVELRATATIEPRADGRVSIVSRDRGQRLTRPLSSRRGEDGPLGLLARLVGAFAPRRGLTLTTEAQAPAGAGLGGSSTLAVAVGAALARHTATRLSSRGLVMRVMNVETSRLGVPTGNQDYLAAVHGGLSAYHHTADGTRREVLRVPRGLERRLVLGYTGEPRQSGFSNWQMFRRFVDGERRARERMEAIARIARNLVEALRAQDLDRVGRLLGEEGQLRYELAPSVGTAALLRADRAARSAGALGVKVCGAGGGGCLVAFAPEGGRERVAAAMARTGVVLLDAKLARRGLRVGSARPH